MKSLLLRAFHSREHAVRQKNKPGITDLEIVFSGRTGFVLGCVALGWSSFGIWIFYFWQFLENLRGASPLMGTAQIVPAGISGLCAAVATGFLLSRLHPGYIMTFSMLAFCAGNILFATMPVSQMYVFSDLSLAFSYRFSQRTLTQGWSC